MQNKKYDKPVAVDLPFEEALERFAGVDPKDVPAAALEAELGSPLRVIEDADTGARFLVYVTKDGAQFDIRYESVEPWFTQLQLAQIYGVTVPTINSHIKQFLADGELDASVIRDFQITAADGKSYTVKHYGLDVAFYVGYRVNSREGMLFRRWATNALVSLATKAFVIDTRRLENPDGQPDYFDELLAKIRHIRSSEKRMWTRVLELASFCSDYKLMTDADREHFFSAVQNAMHWAVTQETAAEVISQRVNAAKAHAGVIHFKGDEPSPTEAKIAKNYYAEAEINALNILTSATLEFFESQAEQKRPTTIAQFLEKMRDFIKLDGRPLIPRGHLGGISMKAAKEKAAAEIAVYKERLRLEKETAGEIAVGELLQKARKIATEKKAKPKGAKKLDKKG